MGGFHVFEKRVPVLDSHLVEELTELGVQVGGESDRVHAHLWVPEQSYEEVLKRMREHGFYPSRAYVRREAHSV